MNAKKQKRDAEKSRVKQQELEKSLTSTRSQLTRTEKKLEKAATRAKRWKKEAKAQRRSAERTGARLKKLQRKLDRAATVPEPAADTGAIKDAADTEDTVDTTQAGTSAPEATAPAAAESFTTDAVTMPDETWTVVQLRAEATARGLTGVSNKPKAQLLAALS